jgi:F-type H+-transporting ATPase subunit gamma
MASTREFRLRVRSVKNLAQVTKALETVSASYVRKDVQATLATRPYAEKAWKVLVHLARSPGHSRLHPLLTERDQVRRVLVVMISGDRGLAGAYNMNILRSTLIFFDKFKAPVSYVAVGLKGRDLLVRRHKDIRAEFSHLPNPPAYMDVSAIGQLVIEDYIRGGFDQVYITYTEFLSMASQRIVIRKLLPLEITFGSAEAEEDAYNVTHHQSSAVFSFEPDQDELLDSIVPRYTAIQIYQAILTSQASEQAARMVAMRNATDNANDLIRALQLEYNKLRQQLITEEMLDITSGAEALKAQ